MNKVPSWNQLVTDNLLKHNTVSGVLLYTRHGQPVYSFGELGVSFNKKEAHKIIQSFNKMNSDNEDKEETFQVNYINGQMVTFTVYQKSYCSVYATSAGNRDGLIVCNLPHGVMLCTYHLPITSGKAVPIVEKFCDLLRA